MSKLALVLGGGAAKGYAHIGVIKVLESIGIKPDMVVGCSMGSVVGGFYAYGYSVEEMESLALQMDLRRTVALLAPVPSITGLIDGRNIVEFFEEHLGKETKIEDLPTRYAAVAVDLASRSEVVITEGSIVHAIRASIAVPGVFAPLDYGDALLVDGGVLDPVPVRAARLLGAEHIIAVNVLPRFDTEIAQINIDKFESGRTHPQSNRRQQFFRMFSEVRSQLKHKFQINAVIVGIASLGMMESEIINRQLSENRPDVVIDVDVPIKTHEFHRAAEAIKSGEDAAQANLHELMKLRDMMLESETA